MFRDADYRRGMFRTMQNVHILVAACPGRGEQLGGSEVLGVFMGGSWVTTSSFVHFAWVADVGSLLAGILTGYSFP